MTDRADLPYAVELSDRAIAGLRSLDRDVARRVVRRLTWLADKAAVYRHTALTGEWRGLYRLRIGDYRAIYELDHEARIVRVALIGHRREIYAE